MRTVDELVRLQALPLEDKIALTKVRIQEWYEHFDGKVYISFSGGKDSTVLLKLVRDLYPDVPAVYVDTGLEYPEVKQHIKTFDNVTIIRPKKSFRQVIEDYGYPVASKEVSLQIYDIRNTKSDYLREKLLHGINGSRSGMLPKKWHYLLNAPFKISHKCCMVMKKSPAHSYAHKTGRKAIVGTMAIESSVRKQSWIRYGCNAFDGSEPTSKPMSFWTEQDVLQYIFDNSLTIPSCYGEIVSVGGVLKTTKCERTGCMYGAYGVQYDDTPNRFQRMKETHPKIYQYCIEQMGMGKVLDYMGVAY